MKEINTDCNITVFAGATHFDVPELVFKNKEFNIIDWVLSQEQTNSILTYSSGRLEIKVAYPGKYTLIFAQSNRGVLKSITYQEYDFAYGRNSKVVPTQLSRGDKIFLWDSLYGLKPVSEAYIVK